MRAKFIESPSGHIGIDLVPEPNDGNEAVLMRQLARQLRATGNRVFVQHGPNQLRFHIAQGDTEPADLKEQA